MDSQRLKVFIDIDGTILYVPPDVEFFDELDGQRVCNGIERFLEFVVMYCEPYWLSYRARLGKTEPLQREILPHLPEIARTIEVAYWDQNKLEALTPDQPFVWYDDFPEPEDEAWLHKHRLIDSLVTVERDQPNNPDLMIEDLKRRLEALQG